MSRQCQCGGLIATHQLTDSRDAWSCKSCGRYEAVKALKPAMPQLTAPAAEIALYSETGALIVPDLLAERDKLKALNIELVAALNHQIEATHALLEWAIEVSDEYLDGEPGTRAELVADMSRAREHAAQARAALAKNKETT